MNGKPQRIICNYVFADEILLDLVTHDRIVGLDKWVHDPGLSSAVEEAKDVVNVVGDSAEYIISLSPDLVILREGQAGMAETLEEVGINVFVHKNTKRIDEIPGAIRAIGDAVGETEKAEELIRDMEEKLLAVKQKVASLPAENRWRTILILRFGPIGGEGSIYHDVMTRAGLIDIYDEVRPSSLRGDGISMILNQEELLHADPELLLLGNWSQGGEYKDSTQQLEEMYANPAYAGMQAIQKKRAIIIPQRYVNCLSHHVADGVEAVYKAVYEKEEP
ncbi:MAG: ABC transporter substrate-binding protein [Veillonellaceae bacterium]|nr:ABC transporter substrate-binding protein [Veillonellaceae bacterium]